MINNRIINLVEVHLDDNISEYMAGLVRIRSVEVFGRDGEPIETGLTLVNQEYLSEKELITSVAGQFGVSEDIVEIA